MDTYAFNRATALYRQVLESPELSEAERHATKVRPRPLARERRPSRRGRGGVRRGRRRGRGTNRSICAGFKSNRCCAAASSPRVACSRARCYDPSALGMPSTRRARRARGDREPTHAAAARPRLQRAHAPTRCPSHLLQRLDVLWSVSSGFALHRSDPGTCAAGALHAPGARGRRARARHQARARLEIGYRSLAGEPSWALVRGAARARRWRSQNGSATPQLRGHIQTTSGLAAFLSGRFDVALERLVEGARALRDLSVGHPVPDRHLRDHARRMPALPRTDPRDEPAARDPRARGRGERRCVHAARPVQLARQRRLAAARPARRRAAQPRQRSSTPRGPKRRFHAPPLLRAAVAHADRSLHRQRSTRPRRACRTNGGSSRGACCCGSSRCGSRASTCAVESRSRVPRERPKAPTERRAQCELARKMAKRIDKEVVRGASRSPSCCALVRRTSAASATRLSAIFATRSTRSRGAHGALRERGAALPGSARRR